MAGAIPEDRAAGEDRDDCRSTAEQACEALKHRLLDLLRKRSG
jgi:hypothetical protein